MTLDEIKQTLTELERVERAALSLDNKATIEALYTEVLDKTFTPTPCNDCYHDAVVEMLCYLRKYGQLKPKYMYKLKNGALLQSHFGSSEFYVNTTLTDEKAREFLRKDPSLIKLFAQYPDNWEEDIMQDAATATETAQETDKTDTTANTTTTKKRGRKTKKA